MAGEILRLPFLTATIVPILVGAAVAIFILRLTQLSNLLIGVGWV
ncbi:MAG: hypothetical protein Ct9H300mP2_1620 [Candidatus Neomarinimicrobiota bacterium]|nr:MAG: hypothetical protein Ct9H300mP2_1620 [Candidatus Neomarinimicrobiota bacterium]